jgi:hypothetical protein
MRSAHAPRNVEGANEVGRGERRRGRERRGHVAPGRRISANPITLAYDVCLDDVEEGPRALARRGKARKGDSNAENPEERRTPPRRGIPTRHFGHAETVHPRRRVPEQHQHDRYPDLSLSPCQGRPGIQPQLRPSQGWWPRRGGGCHLRPHAPGGGRRRLMSVRVRARRGRAQTHELEQVVTLMRDDAVQERKP